VHISWNLTGQSHKGSPDPISDQSNRNPTIEEQALARVYRLGQLKEVTTVRFYVKDTFEEVRSMASPFL
jgi:hypothetical protein